MRDAANRSLMLDVIRRAVVLLLVGTVVPAPKVSGFSDLKKSEQMLNPAAWLGEHRENASFAKIHGVLDNMFRDAKVTETDPGKQLLNLADKNLEDVAVRLETKGGITRAMPREKKKETAASNGSEDDSNTLSAREELSDIDSLPDLPTAPSDDPANVAETMSSGNLSSSSSSSQSPSSRPSFRGAKMLAPDIPEGRNGSLQSGAETGKADEKNYDSNLQSSTPDKAIRGVSDSVSGGLLGLLTAGQGVTGKISTSMKQWLQNVLKGARQGHIKFGSDFKQRHMYSDGEELLVDDDTCRAIFKLKLKNEDAYVVDPKTSRPKVAMLYKNGATRVAVGGAKVTILFKIPFTCGKLIDFAWLENGDLSLNYDRHQAVPVTEDERKEFGPPMNASLLGPRANFVSVTYGTKKRRR